MLGKCNIYHFVAMELFVQTSRPVEVVSKKRTRTRRIRKRNRRVKENLREKGCSVVSFSFFW